jgi:maltose-binding protein MalE
MAALWFAAALLLAACRAGGVPGPTQPPPALSPTASASQVTPDAPTPTSAPSPAPLALRLWTSPEAAPGESVPGGSALARQIAEFEANTPNVAVEVRVKKTSGAGSLLDALRTASAAAPASLPDVVALSRDDLATAAREGLLQPLAPEAASPEALADFYQAALDAARVDGQVYGLPFSADATVLVYNTELRATAPITWTDVLSPTGAYLLPLGDPLGLVTLQQYYALGGTVNGADGGLALDSGLLSQVLAFYQSAAAAGVLPLNSDDYLDPGSTWLAYREQRAALAAAPASLYLREHDRAGSTGARLLPTRDGVALALGTSWSYALVTADPLRQSQALALMQWLTAPAHVGEWSQAAGVLPPRASALDAWTDASQAAFAAQVMPAAQLQPDAAALAVLGPPIRLAVLETVAGRASPRTAAEQAAAAVAGQ